MKIFTISLVSFLFILSVGMAQSLPIDFEASITTEDFTDFDGGTATVIANPQVGGINTSATVAQIVRDGGQVWAGSKIRLSNNLDFSSLSVLSMKVFSTAPIGTVVKFKLEGAGETEVDALTTVANEWETLTWDFTGQPTNFNDLVFMFDFGNLGDGGAMSTFLFDDIEQAAGLAQIDWPVDFEGSTVNYTVTDFDGTSSMLVTDPEDSNNNVIQTTKTTAAGASSGTTIGRPSGFATNLPFTLTDSKMTVRVWSPAAGTPVRLKVEDSNDPTHTCETQTNTSVSSAWETLEFDFINQATGTELLSVGLSQGWTYNMASIFFNFGTSGADAGEQTYYFDDVKFGGLVLGVENYPIEGLSIFPNPASTNWTITANNAIFNSIEVFNLQGQLVRRINPQATTATIETEGLTNGIYLAKIATDKTINTIQLIKVN